MAEKILRLFIFFVLEAAIACVIDLNPTETKQKFLSFDHVRIS